MDLKGIIRILVSLIVLILFLGIQSCSIFRSGLKENKIIENNISSSEIFQQAFSAFVLYDPATKDYIFDWNGHKHHTPASNTKILTLFTSLHILGDSMSLVRYAEKQDTLYVSGTGNPYNLNPYLSQSNELLEWMEEKGHDKIIAYVPASPQPSFYGSGWAWDDYLYAYQLENSSFPLYGNEVFFSYKHDTLKSNPPFFKNKIQILKSDENGMDRSWQQNDFSLSSDGSQYQRILPFHPNDSLIVELLADTLKRDVQLVSAASNDFEWQKLNTLFEDSLYVMLMQDSDNFIAEQLLLMSAMEISDTLDRKVAIDSMSHAMSYFLCDSLRWVDGSGLSRYNLVAPRSFIQILEQIYRDKGMDWIKKIFAQGGTSGTIKNWYKPYVYAKTGSLSNNHNLSGYIETKSGNVLIFSFMHNHFLSPTNGYKMEMEKFLDLIYLHY